MDQVVKRVQNAAQNTVSGTTIKRNRRPTPAALAVKLVIFLVILGLVAFGWMRYSQNGFATAIQKDKYQAVFLTNGQVYFGKINKLDHQGYTLGDIYYLQVQGNVQGQEQQQKDQNQNLSLAKLGSELHGPQDVMYIENKQVLFWENLKDDSQVVKAIKDNKAKK